MIMGCRYNHTIYDDDCFLHFLIFGSLRFGAEDLL